MNDGFKQRLVGAVVLLSTALILWPLVFSGAADRKVDRHSQIPVTPDFDKYTVAEPIRPDNIEPLVQPIEVVPPQTNNTNQPTEKVQQPKLDNKGLPEAWVLQVASFKHKENADIVKKALLAQGHKAFTRSIQTSQGTSIRVYVGPRLIKNAFDKDRLAINKEFSVKSMVVRYQQ